MPRDSASEITRVTSARPTPCERHSGRTATERSSALSQHTSRPATPTRSVPLSATTNVGERVSHAVERKAARREQRLHRAEVRRRRGAHARRVLLRVDRVVRASRVRVAALSRARCRHGRVLGQVQQPSSQPHARVLVEVSGAGAATASRLAGAAARGAGCARLRRPHEAAHDLARPSRRRTARPAPCPPAARRRRRACRRASARCSATRIRRP